MRGSSIEATRIRKGKRMARYKHKGGGTPGTWQRRPVGMSAVDADRMANNAAIGISNYVNHRAHAADTDARERRRELARRRVAERESLS